jgi:hypothetical protein
MTMPGLQIIGAEIAAARGYTSGSSHRGTFVGYESECVVCGAEGSNCPGTAHTMEAYVAAAKAKQDGTVTGDTVEDVAVKSTATEETSQPNGGPTVVLDTGSYQTEVVAPPAITDLPSTQELVTVSEEVTRDVVPPNATTPTTLVVFHAGQVVTRGQVEAAEADGITVHLA